MNEQELYAIAVSVNAAIEGMKVDNLTRERNGLASAYDGDSFFVEQKRLDRAIEDYRVWKHLNSPQTKLKMDQPPCGT